MSFCPHCGAENVDPDDYCRQCGKPLKETLTRNKLREHLEYSIQTFRKYPKIILPEAIFSAINLIIIMLNRDRIIQLYTEYETTGTINFGWQFYVVIAFLIIVSFFWGILYTPFIQHLKLDAINDIEPDFRRSFDYSRGRYWEFFRATLASIALMLGAVFIPFGMILMLGASDFNLGSVTVVFTLIALILVAALVVVLWIASAPSIMVWSGLGFRDSLVMSYRFFRARLGILFITGIIFAIVSYVFDYLPFSVYLNFIPTALFTLTELDIFLNYQKSILDEDNRMN